MRTEAALDGETVELLRTRPSLGRPQHDARPGGPPDVATPGPFFERGDLVEHLVEARGHGLVHLGRLAALDEPRSVAVAGRAA